jgi:uncharacterized NAD(P)/FAD-binding protein YdhS
MRNNLDSDNLFHVVVVGAGASGTLIAAQFKRLAPHGRLALIGSAARTQGGLAYKTLYQSNLLNVAAGKMSAFPHDMDHFVSWLKRRLPKADADTFAPRLLYGEYLAQVFEETVDGSKNVEYIPGSAISVSRKHDLWTIRLDNGGTLEARSVVLALGNLLPPSDPIDFNAVASNYWRNPWAQDAARGIATDASVLLVGTGLTMVDMALTLREVGHRGTIHAISRHGRLYHPHKAYQARPLLTVSVPEDFKSPVGALRWIRAEIKAAEKSGSDWRAVIDSLRPYTAAIWQGWNPTQRSSFLRHARNLWDIHRHRMAPEIANQLSILLKDRTLIIHHGRLVSANPQGSEVVVTWRETGSKEIHTLNVARVVNCTGPSRDYSQIQSPLIAGLRAAGLIVADPLRLGFETDTDGRFIAANGDAVQGLFTLGPIRISSLWESIAIPEIRNQALALAELLVSETIESGILT